MRRPGTAPAILVLFVVSAAVAIPAHAQDGNGHDTLVVLNTGSGKITIEFFPEDAPNHVENFMRLSENGFYDGTLFHRIIPEFMIQGGDPLTAEGASTINEWGAGGPEYTLSEEFNEIKHVRGIVSMARSADPDSAGSQFFIVHADSPHLDGAYTAFGRIITQESYVALDRIASLETTGPPSDRPIDWQGGGPRIDSVDIVDRSDVGDLVELGPPARTEGGPSVMATDQPYRNERLGIEFVAPEGWTIHEPQKSRPDVPDVVAIGAASSEVNPSISVTITHTMDKTLEQRVEERRMALAPAIQAGQLTIYNEGVEDLFGREAHMINATGTFPGDETAINIQYTEITFLEENKFFTMSYASPSSEHGHNYGGFMESVRTFKVDSASPLSLSPDTDGADGAGGCLIATATYGSEMAPQVQRLRDVRDNTVLSTQTGAAFMSGFNQLYYAFSPTIADWERQSPAFRELVRTTIAPLLATLEILNHVEINSEAEMLAYGIGIVALNIGMYLVAPAVVAHKAVSRGRLAFTRHRPTRLGHGIPSLDRAPQT